MLTIFCIFMGAGVGGVLRYAVGGVVQRAAGPAPSTQGDAVFPLGTLAVNLTGCLAIGVLASLPAAWMSRDEVRLGLIVGVLGGYTTFSALGLETLRLLQTGQPGKAAIYIVLSNALGLGAAWAGWAIVRWWTRAA